MSTAQKILLIAFWITVFIPVFFGPIILFSISIVLIGLVIFNTFSLKKKGKKWKLFLLLSPPVSLAIVGFTVGLFGYISGSATFVYNSKSNAIQLDSYQNFDHDYRVYYPDFRGKHYGPISGINLSYMYAK